MSIFTRIFVKHGKINPLVHNFTVFLLPYHVFRILFLSIEFLQKKRRFELTGICWFFQEQPLLHCQARKGNNIVMLLYLKLLRKYSLDQSIKAIDTKNQFVT